MNVYLTLPYSPLDLFKLDLVHQDVFS